ncbi:MAG TPA: AAA family ATPase [Microscillaceae bacterium]|nr:AAA family ATPase [Microscillaceae bacterium]
MVNTTIIENELLWLEQVIDLRFKIYFQTDQTLEVDAIEALEPPPLIEGSDYAQVVQSLQLGFAERLAIALCLAAQVRPQMLDAFFTKNQSFQRHFTEFGGVILSDHSAFLPTGETFVFILTGENLGARLKALDILHQSNPLFTQGILELSPHQENKVLTRQNGVLSLTPEYESRWIYGRSYQPEFSTRFPASPLTPPNIDWQDDLVLPRATKKQLEEIKLWIANKEQLEQEWTVGKQLRPGFRALFYGPPGTGKTLTASLLGKETGKTVYRVDLSMVISKYIGETEKNLARVFNIAAHQDWILFFDEADALFGKRTQTQNSHDRYANQEIAYLLQRFETFDGISLLATNLRDNIDEAFTRRFESIIYFPLPEPDQRLKLWQKVLPITDDKKFASDIDLHQIAQKYKLSGGAIANVARHASLHAIANGGCITSPLLLEGIQREYSKEGRTV